ncbi:MAG: hypothetical protein IPN17_37295 [Deltaproteobacteria bacterium]|nr:hypothetical protein [Deltaproteobacteria bacterium]
MKLSAATARHRSPPTKQATAASTAGHRCGASDAPYSSSTSAAGTNTTAALPSLIVRRS